MNLLEQFDKLKKPECAEEKKKFREFRKLIKSMEENSKLYSLYFMNTMDGTEPEEAARDLGLI
jgi:hypothetical protein